MFMYLIVLYNLLNDTSIITEITNAEKLNFLKYSKLSLFLGRKTIITTELSNSFTLSCHTRAMKGQTIIQKSKIIIVKSLGKEKTYVPMTTGNIL